MTHQTEQYQKHHLELIQPGEVFYSTNPTNQDVIWKGKTTSNEEIDKAYADAVKANSPWASLHLHERIVFLERFAKHVQSNHKELTHLIALETGKPYWEAATETQSVIGKIALSIQAYQERSSEKIKSQDEIKNCLRYKPHGVVVVLGAFNFPAHLSNGHIVPALLAGNTVIYKPSELTPAVAEFVVNCWHDSGLPPGVLNLIQGNAQTAKKIFEYNIQGVYFTGSYRAGAAINQYFSHRPEVILALEMGGNNPLIIDEISNISAAVYNTILSSFLTAGQRCTCARRVIIPNNTGGDEYLNALIFAAQSIRVGAPDDTPEPFMGPVISEAHAKQHLHAQDELQALGGLSLLKMQHSGLLSPGIMDMSQVANPPDEEIFAPFIQIYRYKDFEHAIALANQTRYGLAAGLISENAAHYQVFYNTIRAGLINWNRPTTGAAGNLPFGGVGRSGNHRPSAYFAADYCAYPIASIEEENLKLPAMILPGVIL